VTQSSGIKWAQAVLLLVWFFMYGWSFGPLPYVICSEIGSAQLRSKVSEAPSQTSSISLP
jgi:hypothetical protein